MIHISPLKAFSQDDLHRIMPGYTSTEKYAVQKVETPEQITFVLTLVTLDESYVKCWPDGDQDEIDHYRRIAQDELSLGAYDGDQLVGLALVERRAGNRTLWVWEVGVAETHRRRCIGTRLLDTLAEGARFAGFRVMTLEVQNTNVPAIRFYRAAGFEIEAIDLSYYTNDDITDGEVAIFMKRKLL